MQRELFFTNSPAFETPSDTISDPAVAKLLEIDSDLAHQEALLSAQLESIGEKRRSLKTVIDLFDGVDTTTIVKEAAPAIAASHGTRAQIQPATLVVASAEPVGSVDETIASIELESSPAFTTPVQNQ